MDQLDRPDLVGLTAEIVSAYVSKNTVGREDLGSIISDVHDALSRASNRVGGAEREELKPAIALKKSVTPDYIVCLEDGKKFKSLEAAPAYPLQPFPRRIPGEMGPAARLPDGGPELRCSQIPARQADGPGHPQREVARRAAATTLR